MNFYSKVIPVVFASMLLALCFGFVKVNFYHNLSLPTEVLHKNTITTSHSLNLTFPFFHTNSDIYMVDEIKEYRQTQDIIQTLNEASAGSTVTFHLAGYGGQVDSVMRILNAMKMSKAHVVTEVEAPVYSGHAYIALSGQTLKIRPYTIIMMHHSSGYNQQAVCDKETGTNRAMTNKDSCLLYLNTSLEVTTVIIQQMSYLTAEQKQVILEGRDLYLMNLTGKLITLEAK